MTSLNALTLRIDRAATRMGGLLSDDAALSLALRNVASADRSLAFIRRNAGKPLTARFAKANGSVRVMRFLGDADATMQRGCVRVFDLERGAMRSVNLDTLAAIGPAPAVVRRDAPAPVLPAASAEMTDDELDVMSREWFDTGA